MAEAISEMGYKAGLCGYHEDVWQKQGMIFAFNDRWIDKTAGVTTEATYGLNIDPVDAGYMYYLQYIEYYQEDVAARIVDIFAFTESEGSMVIYHDPSATQSERIAIPVGVCLKEGDYIRAVFRGMTVGKTVYVIVWGYKMKLDM